jgi:hypothetical protein
MRRLLFALLGVVATALPAADTPRSARAEEVALFKDAMKHGDQDTEHWAYTETTIIKDKKGQVRNETVVRFDPSKPYAEQFMPLKIDGKPPTEGQLRKYRKEGEKRGKQLVHDAEAKAHQPDNHEAQLTIDEGKVVLDLDHPLVVQDEAGRTTFEVQLRAEKGSDLPVEKFQILVQVGKQTRLIERAVFRIREAFRVMLVAKIKAGEASIDFTVVDPNFSPVITSITGNVGASLLFIPVNATLTNHRTDWQRVKAFDERFSVRLAPLQTLGF